MSLPQPNNRVKVQYYSGSNNEHYSATIILDS